MVEDSLGRRYTVWLLGLSGLFVFRVLAQLAQAFYPLPFLPAFDAWHGAVLPYPALFACQVMIVTALMCITWSVATDRIGPRFWKSRLCYALGVPYFLVMSFRLVAGLTFLADQAWFAKSLPAVFHLVLASILLVLGRYIQVKCRSVPAGTGSASYG